MQREVFNTISMSSISTCTPFLYMSVFMFDYYAIAAFVDSKGKLY